MQLTPLRTTTLAAVIMAGAFPLTTWAQETLDTVVVTAAGHEQQIKEAPASITVVTRQDLEKKAFANLHDAIRDIPGVTLTPSDNNSNDISLRGMGADYTLILIDGKRANSRETQTNGSTGTDQSWMPPLEAIERIEVVRGPMSSLYGSDAIGGVINIITRKVADKWMGSLRTEAVVQESSKSGDEYRTNFYISGPIVHEQIGLSLNGSFTKRDEDKIFNGFKKGETKSLGAKLSLKANKNHDFVLEAGASEQQYIGRFNFSVNPNAARASESDSQYQRDNVSVQHNGQWGWAKSTTYLQKEKVENERRKMTIENTVFNSSWTAPVGDNNLLNFGASYDIQDLVDLSTNGYPGAKVNSLSRDSWAVYAENEWRVNEAFALTVGGRYDNVESLDSHFSPRVYGVWTLNPNWTIKGGVSTGFKAPKLRNLAGEWAAASNGGATFGNPNLKPEKSLSKEIGFIYDSLQGTSLAVTVFDNEYEDKISRVKCPECNAQWGLSNANTYVNVSDAITRGFELSAEKSLGREFKIKANYTFTKTEQKSGDYAGNPLNQMPRHLFNTTLEWNPNDALNAWARYAYRGKESFSSGGPSSGDFVQKGYGMFDVGGSYDVNKTTTLMLGIYNILDKEVRYDGISWDTVQDGRRYWLGMNVKF